ncbi:hypothetical protein [Pseudomonas syringae]|jgi:hypothetical protein|uniref:Secreted protein n=1 Tax=Pseudomonas syringae TaxID=317 RepID=A0A085V3J9_PSESX|nr:hypothetical protein [Pseudomonas syringae]KFE50012.1 hypothetical protein IV02_17965 [Pseudomonas syringae]
MKRTIALSFAFSVLTATAAFASPHAATSVAQPVVAQASIPVADAHAAAAGSKTFDRAYLQLDSKVLVAENRKEFGSQYQRY